MKQNDIFCFEMEHMVILLRRIYYILFLALLLIQGETRELLASSNFSKGTFFGENDPSKEDPDPSKKISTNPPEESKEDEEDSAVYLKNSMKFDTGIWTKTLNISHKGNILKDKDKKSFDEIHQKQISRLLLPRKPKEQSSKEIPNILKIINSKNRAVASVSFVLMNKDFCTSFFYEIPYTFVSGWANEQKNTQNPEERFLADFYSKPSDFYDTKALIFKDVNSEFEAINDRITLSRYQGEKKSFLINEYQDENPLKFFHSEQAILGCLLKRDENYNIKNIIKTLLEEDDVKEKELKIYKILLLVSSQKDACRVCRDTLYCASHKDSSYTKNFTSFIDQELLHKDRSNIFNVQVSSLETENYSNPWMIHSGHRLSRAVPQNDKLYKPLTESILESFPEAKVSPFLVAARRYQAWGGYDLGNILYNHKKEGVDEKNFPRHILKKLPKIQISLEDYHFPYVLQTFYQDF